MRIYSLLLITLACFVFAHGSPMTTGSPLLGSKVCTWGPSYWCQNLTAAGDCHATKHCVQTIWIHKQLPPDHSSVCQICLDMVKQARDQLESNETQELIKEVFEGSCALIHIKPIVEECDKIADKYIPDLVETLASEMDPQVVCSVAGLCNNEKVDKLLTESKEIRTTDEASVKIDKCKGCYKVVDIIQDKFQKTSRDDFLQGLLIYCGKLGSFSDGCSNLVITYFTEIYNHLQEHLNSQEICMMSGECSAMFHDHRARVEITPNSRIGYVPVSGVEDDLPCQLCEQLVDHLRNLLTANTTEDEFKLVLEGLCKQMKQFSSECIALVDQYYEPLYDYLVNQLNSTQVCKDIGICSLTQDERGVFIAPLLSADNADKVITTSAAEKSALSEVDVKQQLPIELLVPPHTQLYNKQVCEFCIYFLHYLQTVISYPKTEDTIKEVIDKACQKLPSGLNKTCVEFVEMYEPALVAILVEEIDPSQVCPMIKACPAAITDVEKFMETSGDSKCPLCLVAITQLEDMLKNNKSKAAIKEALTKLCKILPTTIDNECEDFVAKYTDQIIEMIETELTPEEVCVHLHLCIDLRPANPLPNFATYQPGQVRGDIETNGILDNTVNGHLVDDTNKSNKNSGKDSNVKSSPECVICEFVMNQIENQLKNNKTDQTIENVVKSICKIMPSSVDKECTDFIDQYADTVIQLLIAALEPSDICSFIKLCDSSTIKNMKVQILECPVCEVTVDIMDHILENPKVDHAIEHVLEKTCRGVPIKYRSSCMEIVDTYGIKMIDMIVNGSKKEICSKLGYCKSLWSQVVID